MARASSSRRITEDTLRNIIIKRLPKLLEKEPPLRDYLANLLAEKFAPKGETEETIREILQSIREQNKRIEEQNRRLDEYGKRFEEQNKRLEEQNKRLEEQNKRLEEHSKILEEQNRRLEEHSKLLEEHTRRLGEHSKRLEEHSKILEQQNRRLEEHSKLLEEHTRRLEEHSKRLEEHSRILEELIKEVKLLRRDYNRFFGALGARWGLHSERSFRDGMKAILESDFGIKVERYHAMDTEGKVFGKPDQVELDLVIHNGKMIVVEIKSSASKADLSVFWKKVKFFEEREGKKVDRMIVISPMVDSRALDFAKDTNMEVYTWPEDVEILG